MTSGLAVIGNMETVPASYAELAPALGLSEAAAAVAVHRLRRRCCGLLRAEIAQTVASPNEVDDEIRSLFVAFES